MSIKGMAVGAMMLAGSATVASAQADIGVCHLQDIKSASFTHMTIDDKGGMAGFQKSNGEKFEINLDVLGDSVIGNGFTPSAKRMSDIGDALKIMNADMLGVSSGGEVHALVDNEWKQLSNFETKLLDAGNEDGFKAVSVAGSTVARIADSMNYNCSSGLLVRSDGPNGMK